MTPPISPLVVSAVKERAPPSGSAHWGPVTPVFRLTVSWVISSVIFSNTQSFAQAGGKLLDTVTYDKNKKRFDRNKKKFMIIIEKQHFIIKNQSGSRIFRGGGAN